jgi:predicted amidohydrolase
MKLGIIQMPVVVGNYKANITYAVSSTRHCIDNNCQVICLPEVFAYGLDFSHIDDYAETIPGDTTQTLCELSKQGRVDIIAGILEKDGGKFYSTVVYISDGFIISGYRRIHLYGIEKHFMCAGDSISVIDSRFGRFGLLCGYDLSFPELPRLYFRSCTEMIICCAAIPYPFAESSLVFAQSRAIENSCYFALVTNVGENRIAGLKYAGRSAVFQSSERLDIASGVYYPQQSSLYQSSNTAETFFVEVDPTALKPILQLNADRLNMLDDYSSINCTEVNSQKEASV